MDGRELDQLQEDTFARATGPPYPGRPGLVMIMASLGRYEAVAQLSGGPPPVVPFPRAPPASPEPPAPARFWPGS